MANIVVRDPFDIEPLGFTDFRRMIDRMFHDGWPARMKVEEMMPLDISERDGMLMVEASLPGFDREEIEVEVSGGVLTIKAHHEEEKEEEEQDYFRRERHVGTVQRRIELPGVIMDDAKMEAELKNGVLMLTIEMPAEAKAKKVEIKAA